MTSEYRRRRGGDGYDDDDDRLPHGMVRCGYDADTETYFFWDTGGGGVWEGTRGTYYGLMNRIWAPGPVAPPPRVASTRDLEASSLESDTKESRVVEQLNLVERWKEREDRFGARDFVKRTVWRDTVEQLVVSGWNRLASVSNFIVFVQMTLVLKAWGRCRPGSLAPTPNLRRLLHCRHAAQ